MPSTQRPTKPKIRPLILRLANWFWSRSSSTIAVLAIIFALVIGYRLGSPSGSGDEHTGHAHTQEETADIAPTMYTCSMHPSVRLPDKDAKCPICFMDLIPVSRDAGSSSPTQLVLDPAAAELSQIETAKAGRFFPATQVRLYGKLREDETSLARLTAWFPGRIDKLFVNYVGVPVAKGDHIADLYSPDLLAAFEELRQAKQATTTADTASDFVRETSKQTLVAAREKLRLFGLTSAQIQSAEQSPVNQDTLTIHAPITGVVTELKARQGDYLKIGSPIATVADLSRLWLDLQAYESQLPLLNWGQSVEFTVESHPGETFKGRVVFIEPTLNEQTRTAAVRVEIDNRDKRLKPGMFASAIAEAKLSATGVVAGTELLGKWISPMHPTVVKDGPGECDICGMDLVPAESLGIVGDPAKDAAPIVIPKTAVLFTGKRSVVYVQLPDTEKPTYEFRKVVLGPRAGDLYTVREGLKEGESVVVQGAFRIDSAMQINAKPSMMSPTGGAGMAGHDHGNHAGQQERHTSKAQAPEHFIHSLKPIYAAYFDAQEALAEDDIATFVVSLKDLKNALQLVSETGLVGDPLAQWRRAANKLRVTSTITDIQSARFRFETLSDGVIELQKSFGHHGQETYHVAYCPMAFENQGAEWMQRDDTVNNPYFGASMLRCGEMRQSMPPRRAAIAPVTNQHEGHSDE